MIKLKMKGDAMYHQQEIKSCSCETANPFHTHTHTHTHKAKKTHNKQRNAKQLK